MGLGPGTRRQQALGGVVNLSELIEKAEAELAMRGDIPVLVPDTGCGCCRSYTYDPAAAEVETNVKAWDGSYRAINEIPLAFVVQ